MLTTAALLGAFLVIGFVARSYSRRTRLLMVGVIVAGVMLLMRG